MADIITTGETAADVAETAAPKGKPKGDKGKPKGDKGKPKGKADTNTSKGGKGGKSVPTEGKSKGKEAAPAKAEGLQLRPLKGAEKKHGIPVEVTTNAAGNLRCNVAGISLTGMMRWLGSQGVNPAGISHILNVELGIGRVGNGVMMSTIQTYGGGGGRRAPGADQTKPIPAPAKEYRKALLALAPAAAG